MSRPFVSAALVLAALYGCAFHGGAAGPATGFRDLDIAQLWERGSLRPVHRTVEPFREGERSGIRVDERDVRGVVWLEGMNFGSGVIEVDVRGRDKQGSSFVGVAFHGVNDTTYDAVYVRPFNFRSDDPVRRGRAVQYISHPVHTWSKLREEHPGVFEAAIDPAPDPEGWVRLRVAVANDTVRVYVNGEAHPSLVVNQLSSRRGGRIGLWVGNPSDAAYSRLRVRASEADPRL